MHVRQNGGYITLRDRAAPSWALGVFLLAGGVVGLALPLGLAANAGDLQPWERLAGIGVGLGVIAGAVWWLAQEAVVDRVAPRRCIGRLRQTIIGAPLILTLIVVLAACGRGNGLPADIRSHLAERGIMIRPSRVHAPLSRRDGYIVMQYDPHIAASIIAVLGLERIHPDVSQWRLALARAGGAASPKELWGVLGRPSQLKLKDGSQFEYLYLLVTTDGSMYLLAEYAYG